MGVCAVLAGGCASANSAVQTASSAQENRNNPFVGRWHWNRAQSAMPPDDPMPGDVTVEISRADSAHLKWSLTGRSSPGGPNVETPNVQAFDAPANGDFYPVSDDITAAFRVTGSTLRATFQGPSGLMDAQTCTLAANQKEMICQGALSDREGPETDYVDVYARM